MKHYETKENPQSARGSVCVGHPLLSMGPTLKCACIPTETPLGKTNCSFARAYQLEMAPWPGKG